MVKWKKELSNILHLDVGDLVGPEWPRVPGLEVYECLWEIMVPQNPETGKFAVVGVDCDPEWVEPVMVAFDEGGVETQLYGMSAAIDELPFWIACFGMKIVQ